MVFPPEFWWIFLAAALVCSIGFKKYVWFISIGYGLSIAAMGIALPIVYAGRLDVLRILLCLLMLGYGLRLGGFLLFRELKSAAYNSKMKGEISDGSHMKFPIKVMLWLSCVLLYLMMASPALYRFANDAASDGWLIAGEAVMLAGILLEAASDKQKSAAKKINPKRFCDSGLFKIVRCPNYLGELILWTGMLLTGVSALQTVGQWIVAIIGWLGIVYVMFSGARRLELRQDRTYGADPEYQAYVARVPILLPFVPLYSVKKHKWLVG